MLGRSVGAVAILASALTVDAFLLPPVIAAVESTSKDFTGLAINPETQSIKLLCPECVLSGQPDDITEGLDDLFTIQGGANSVLLNFTVEEDGKKLKMNGFTLWPIPGDFGSFLKPTAYQVPASASFVEIASGNINKQALEISRNSYLALERPPSPTGDSAIEFTFSITSIDGRRVSVNAARVSLFKDSERRLMILDVAEAPSLSNDFDEMEHPAIEESKCAYLPALLCKAKDTIESKVKGLKVGRPKFGGCHGNGKGKGTKLPTHIRPNLDIFEGEGEDRPNHHHGRPPKFGNDSRPPHLHHHHDGHHHHHHFMHKVTKAFVTITVPVVAGMTMGMTVSLVGMLVGRLIVFIWTSYVRGGRRGYASVAQQEDEAEAPSKADEVFVHVEEEPLPKYEQAPAYDEKEEQS